MTARLSKLHWTERNEIKNDDVSNSLFLVAGRFFFLFMPIN